MARGRRLQRVTDLNAPPVVGSYYLVPTVTYLYDGKVLPWPVYPSLHEDAEHLNFPWPHYHFDARFMTHRMMTFFRESWGRTEAENLHAKVLQRNKSGTWSSVRPLVQQAAEDTVPHPPIVWRRMQCKRATPAYPFAGRKPLLTIQAAHAGQQCRKNPAGWVCPHRNYPLGSHLPDADGVITCPLHGLRIRAADGVVLDRADCEPMKVAA